MDSVLKSAMVGRVAATVCAVVAFGLGYMGYTFSPEAQGTVVQAIGQMAGVAAMVLPVVSKIRESKK